MEQQQPRPPSYVAHNSADLTFPSVPKTDVSHAHATAEITLPDLKTVLSPDFHHSPRLSGFRPSTAGQESPRSVNSLPRIDPGPQSANGQRRSIEAAVASPSEVGSAMSIDEQAVRSPSISMDDPDVRIAAEALSGLGNPDFIRSPALPKASESNQSVARPVRTSHGEEEPLFQLFAKAHPWVSGTINGSLSAYSTTKDFSPRFVQAGAKLIEDRIVLPVASTAGTVGRVTGVESGMRWYYGGNTRHSSDLERGEDDPRSKRRRVMDKESDGTPSHMQHYGAEELPAYGASKPPSYREEESPASAERQAQNGETGQGQSWSSQVLVMTSGLGVALSETSRRNLRGCLAFLARQAEHISTMSEALTVVLEDYDQARDTWHHNHDATLEKGERPQTPDHDEAARALAAVIKKHSENIWRTMQQVVTSISSYAGGALPENARHFVRTQLMSLPQRWRVASDTHTGGSETSRGAHRMITFATEGLDMISQVSQTMQLTLESAEQWLDRVGRRRDTTTRSSAGRDSKDHDMTNAPQIRDVEKQ